ncbi:hypothetical protein [Aestuariivirga sp.]|uniref:hypothetical protein n=1 Tax=Aestuariivirga sp. TaxID=2650926 RepID=UPI0035940103
MTSLLQLDPVDSALALLDCITGRNGDPGSIEALARNIDAFLYSMHSLQPALAPIGRLVDDEPPETPDHHWQANIGPRYPTLGLYWTMLSSRIVSGEEPQISAGDAIDDLTDIARELAAVDWHLNIHGRSEALAALRWCYKVHLYMHLVPLRAHLEELIFGN